MSVGRQVNWKGQMRVDVPHMRAMESSIVYDFDLLAGNVLAGANPYVLSGFSLSSWVVGQDPDTLTLNVPGGIIFNPQASENGTMLQVPTNRALETLSVANSRVEGAWTSGTVNYIGIDFVRTEDSATSDIVQFIDATTLATTPKTIPLGRTLDYRIVISTSPFSTNAHLCPIAKVTLDAGGLINTIADARTMYFRLAEGGDSPNPLGVYDWPEGRDPEVVTSFTGGDKAITNEKDWKSAVMHRIWEVTGGEYWYSNVTDRNIKFYADQTATHARGGITNNVIWTGGLVSWTGLHVLLDNSTGTVNNITDDNVGVAMADGDVAYVELDRYTDGAALAVTVVTTAAYKALAAPTRVGSRYIVFWRKGADVYSRLDWLAVGRYSGAATTTGYGVVKTNSVNQPAGGPWAIISDSGVNGKAVASGLTRGGAGDGLGAGTISIGNGANDTGILAQANGAGYAFDILNTGTGAGLRARGANNTDAIVGEAFGTGIGVKGTGGGTSGTGGKFTGGAPNGNGVEGYGDGNGYGVVGVGGDGATDGAGGRFQAGSANADAALYIVEQNTPTNPGNGALWYDTTVYAVRSFINGWQVDLTPRECGANNCFRSSDAVFNNATGQQIYSWPIVQDAMYEIEGYVTVAFSNPDDGIEFLLHWVNGGAVFTNPYDCTVTIDGWASIGGNNLPQEKIVPWVVAYNTWVVFANNPVTTMTYRIHGIFKATSTGTFSVDMRSHHAVNTITLKEGSYLKFWRRK